MADTVFGNMDATSSPKAATILYGIALADSNGGTVLVRIGDEVTAAQSWSAGGGNEWLEIDPSLEDDVDTIDLLETADDENDVITAEYQDADSSDEQAADDAAEHGDSTAPVDSDNFEYAEIEQPAWNDELLEADIAYTETMPDDSGTAPSDTDTDDAANDPHVAQTD